MDNPSSSRLDELAEEIHAHRNSPGVHAVWKLLGELHRLNLLAMSKGTKESFDRYQGMLRIIDRLMQTIESGNKHAQYTVNQRSEP